MFNFDENGNETVMQINIDLFALQVFALLMCKGTVKEKANYFVDLIMGDKVSGSIACNSRRMKLAI